METGKTLVQKFFEKSREALGTIGTNWWDRLVSLWKKKSTDINKIRKDSGPMESKKK